jgi:hypothetical protein
MGSLGRQAFPRPASHARPPRGPSYSSKIFPSLLVPFSPTVRPRKSFSCNTYGPPRKWCKQKTYSRAKPFRCNTYKKQGERSVMVNHHPSDIDVGTFRPSDFRFRPLFCELCALSALCVKSFFCFRLSAFNFRPSTSSHESPDWLSRTPSDKIASLPAPRRQMDRANEDSP